MRPDDNVELLIAQVSCVNEPWISPANRGKRDALVSLHNRNFLWTEDGDTVGFVTSISPSLTPTDLIYVPEHFAGQDFLADNCYLLKYLCPVSGNSVRKEIERLTARSAYAPIRAGGPFVGYVAGLFTDQLIGDTLDTIRNATHSGYHEVGTGRLYFDAPIKRQHLSIRTVGQLRAAGHHPQPTGR